MKHLLFEYHRGNATLSFRFQTENKTRNELIEDMQAFAELLNEAFKDVSKEVENLKSTPKASG